MSKNKSHLIAKITIIIAVIALIVYGNFLFQTKSKNPYEFTWERSQNEITLADLTKSATCSFNKDINTFYYQNFSKFEKEKNIHYVVANSDPADTMTFVDLDTPQPRVRTNTGESILQVINDNSESITLISIPPSMLGVPTGDVVIYRLFKQDGVLVYADTHSGFLGPTGTLEMGYCH